MPVAVVLLAVFALYYVGVTEWRVAFLEGTILDMFFT
jgi:hypothetical protein